MPWVLKTNPWWWEKDGIAKRTERMNAISIWARSASALQDTCKNRIFHPSAVRELEEVRWRWSGEGLERWTRGQRRGKYSLINTSCLQIFSLRKDWQRGIFLNDSWSSCTSASPHQAHKVGERLANAAALPDFRGQCSGSWLTCFRPAHLVFWLAAPALLCDPEV